MRKVIIRESHILNRLLSEMPFDSSRRYQPLLDLDMIDYVEYETKLKSNPLKYINCTHYEKELIESEYWIEIFQYIDYQLDISDIEFDDSEKSVIAKKEYLDGLRYASKIYNKILAGKWGISKSKYKMPLSQKITEALQGYVKRYFVEMSCIERELDIAIDWFGAVDDLNKRQ